MILLFTALLFPCFGQIKELSGIVTVENNDAPLSDVRIFIGDSIKQRTTDNGKFLLSVEIGDSVRFWKSGYYFKTLNVNELTNNVINIRLKKSTPAVFFGAKGETYKTNAVFLDGKAVPREDWNDINPDEIKSIGINDIKDDEVRVTYKTK